MYKMIRSSFLVGLCPVAILVSSPALAQAPETAANGAQGASSEEPEARTGFQLALRTGVGIPMGTAEGSPDGATPAVGQRSFVTYQVPLDVDVGWKIIPDLFVGVYAGIAFGGGGDSLGCGQSGTTCASASIRGGLEAQYHFLPGGKVNPWVGYGIGFESTGVAVQANGSSHTDSYALAGWDYGHFMAGADFRLTHVFGLGPFADFSLGRYTKTSQTVAGVDSSGDVAQAAMHEWLTLGVRGTFFP